MRSLKLLKATSTRQKNIVQSEVWSTYSSLEADSKLHRGSLRLHFCRFLTLHSTVSFIQVLSLDSLLSFILVLMLSSAIRAEDHSLGIDLHYKIYGNPGVVGESKSITLLELAILLGELNTMVVLVARVAVDREIDLRELLLVDTVSALTIINIWNVRYIEMVEELILNVECAAANVSWSDLPELNIKTCSICVLKMIAGNLQTILDRPI